VGKTPVIESLRTVRERQANVKKHGPLGKLLLTTDEENPPGLDEVQVLGQIYELIKPFGYYTRLRMLNWLERRSGADEDKRQDAER
jgi:hypothetical protein